MRILFLKTVGMLFNSPVSFEANQGVTLNAKSKVTYMLLERIKTQEAQIWKFRLQYLFAVFTRVSLRFFSSETITRLVRH